jgi:hypothetical protein
MTSSNDPLDRLAPALPWKPDWADVLDRAGEHSPNHRLLTKRRLARALALLAAVLIPLAALGAASDWWFFRFGDAPTPLSAPVVVKEGEWSGHPWQLIAYPSSTDGLCVSVIPTGSKPEGFGGAMGCAPMAGVRRTAETKGSSDMTITFLSGSAGSELPAYVAGPVTDKASNVEIRFGTGEVLRVPTFSAPASLGHVRFYATQLPASVTLPGSDTGQRFIDKLTGLDNDGDVVACLVPLTAVDGVSPLSDCRRS